MKQFWKSKTIWTALIIFLLTVTDYFLQWGLISFDVTDYMELDSDGETILAFNWVSAASSLIFIILRAVTSKGVGTKSYSEDSSNTSKRSTNTVTTIEESVEEFHEVLKKKENSFNNSTLLRDIIKEYEDTFFGSHEKRKTYSKVR